MNRRGHLSHKVPNVKLRPAPAASSSTSKKRKQRDADSPEMWRQQYDEEGEGDHDEPMDSANARPWDGIVITFTGVEEKVRKSGIFDGALLTIAELEQAGREAWGDSGECTDCHGDACGGYGCGVGKVQCELLSPVSSLWLSGSMP